MNKKGKKIISSLMLMAFVFTNTVATVFAVEEQPKLRGVDNTIKLRAGTSFLNSGGSVNLSLRDSDVKQVLRMFADKAGMNIIFDKDVSGTVTLDLVGVSLNAAFDLVLGVSGLNYVVEGNTIVISSANSKSTIGRQEITLIPVKYIDASALAQFLNKNIFAMQKPGLSNAEVVTSNPLTNELLVMGTANDAAIARKIVEKFDKQPISTTVKVNHTTPEQMANLICSTLIPATSSTKGNSGGSSSGSSSSGSSSTSTSSSSQGGSNPIMNMMTGAAASLFGVPTGFASSSSSSSSRSSSSSSSSSGSSSGSGNNAVKLGGGTVACTITPLATGKLATIPVQSLSISYFTQLGTIGIMGGSSEQQLMIQDFIAAHDKKQPQAYLEVAILELNEEGSKTLDNVWSYQGRYFSFSFNGEAGQSTLKTGTNDSTSALHYAMKYIITNSKGRVVANPRILITNGQESVIDLTSDYVKTVTSQVVTNSVSSTPTIQRTYEIGDDNGIKVTITPFISPDGYVTMNIVPDYSSIKDVVTTPNQADPDGEPDLGATLLQRRNLDLKNVRIKDGETLVIGGMITEHDEKDVNKIPFLGDIPGLGVLFRYTYTSKEKAEMVIMITPRIVVDTEDADKENVL